MDSNYCFSQCRQLNDDLKLFLRLTNPEVPSVVSTVHYRCKDGAAAQSTAQAAKTDIGLMVDSFKSREAQWHSAMRRNSTDPRSRTPLFFQWPSSQTKQRMDRIVECWRTTDVRWPQKTAPFGCHKQGWVLSAHQVYNATSFSWSHLSLWRLVSFLHSSQADRSFCFWQGWQKRLYWRQKEKHCQLNFKKNTISR